MRRVLALLATAAALAGASVAEAAPTPGAGCQDGFTPVVHRSGARLVAPQPPVSVACGSRTGVASTGPSIAVSEHGVAFVALNDGGLLRSRDGGVSWERVDPGADAAGNTHVGGLHGNVWIDRTTNRLFYVTFGRVKSCGDTGVSVGAVPVGSGEFLSFSDDEGKTWKHSFLGCDMYDWPKVFTGKPVTSKTKGYPNVVYVAASYPLPLGPIKKVYKSLDGGLTWRPTGEVASDSFEAGQGVTGPDGSIYFDEVYTRGADAQLAGSPYPYDPRQQGKMRIVISRDEGDTWKHVPIEEANGVFTTYGAQRVAVDDAGNVYAAWTDPSDHKPHLSISRDGGLTWPRSITIQPPEVKESNFLVQVAARGRGQIAVSYFGGLVDKPYPSGAYVPDGRAYSGYVARSTNALAASPMFTTGRVNPLDKPLTSDLQLTDPAGETMGAALGPDGTAWGSFVRTTDPYRPGPAVGYPDPPHEIVVGRLLPAPVPTGRMATRCTRREGVRVQLHVSYPARVRSARLLLGGHRLVLHRMTAKIGRALAVRSRGRRLLATVRFADGRDLRLRRILPRCR